MSKVTDVFGQFGSDEEKEQFMAAQLQTINNLTKQVEQLRKEKKQLEDQVKKSATPSSASDKQQDEISFQDQICKEQLRLLNSVSLERELTAEEARKVEIYSKILAGPKTSDKKQSSPVDNMTQGELLKLVNSGDE